MHNERPTGRAVLIVESDQTVRDLQKHFLDKAGLRAEFAADGAIALALAQTQPVVIVTEILIPQIDGLTLCRLLREDRRTREIPVVIFSILAAEARALAAGATVFIRKPLVETTFVATIRSLIAATSTEQTEQKWVSQ